MNFNHNAGADDIEARALYRRRVETQMAPFAATPREIELLVLAQGDIVASAAVFAALLGRLEREGVPA